MKIIKALDLHAARTKDKSKHAITASDKKNHPSNKTLPPKQEQEAKQPGNNCSPDG